VSLNLFEHEVPREIHTLQSALVALGSTLTLATSAGVVTPDIESVITSEIDVVLRYVRNHYVVSNGAARTGSSSTLQPARTEKVGVVRRKRPQIPVNDLSSDAVLVYSDLNDRTSRIKTVLEAKPEATIKDLSEIITDVSTKTIQRDLNSLIESGEVIRQGERRWSKYSIRN
jgi:predicted HTH transcriptional regulator